MTSLGLYFLGACAFGCLAYMSLTSKMTIDDDVNNSELSFIKWTLFFLFLTIAFGCVYNLVKVKTYSLTKQNLIIKHLLFSYKKTIPFSEIESVTEKKISMKMSRGIQNVTNFNEKETSIRLVNGKNIKFDSSLITNYTEFKKTISELI